MRLVSRDYVEIDIHELHEEFEKAQRAEDYSKVETIRRLYEAIEEYCLSYKSGGSYNLDKSDVELPKKIYINMESLNFLKIDILTLPIAEETILNAYAIAAYTRNYEMLEKIGNLFSLDMCLPSQIEDDVKEYILRNGINIKEYLFGQKIRTVFFGNYSVADYSLQFIFNEPFDKVNSHGLKAKPTIPINSGKNKQNQSPQVFNNKDYAKFFGVVNEKYAVVQKSDIVGEYIHIENINRLNCSPYIRDLFKLMLLDNIDKVYISLDDSAFKSLGFKMDELPLSPEAINDVLGANIEPEIWGKLFEISISLDTTQKKLGRDVLEVFFCHANEIKEGYFYDGSTIKYRNLDEEQKGNKVNKIFPPHQPLGK